MKKITKLFLSAAFVFSLNHVCAQPTIQWQKSLGGTSDEAAYSIQQTSDGGYIIAGYTSSNDGDVTGNHGGSDCWVAKLNSTGNLQWQKALGGTANDEAHAVQQTSDGGYIVAGKTLSSDGDVTGAHGFSDCWVVKLDGSGTIQWQKALGGTADDEAASVQQTSDGGYIVAGESFSNDGDATGNHGGGDYWVVKLNSSGTLQWQKSLGGANDDWAASIQQTSDSGYVVAGKSFSTGGDVTGHHGSTNRSDYWVVKLDGSGTLVWQVSLGGTFFDEAKSIQQTSDGGYIVAGRTGSTDGDVIGNHGGYDYWVVKLSSTGTMQWQSALGGTGDDEAWSIQQTLDGGFIVAGSANSTDGDQTGNHGSWDFWSVKLNGSGTIQWQSSIGGTNDDGAYSIQQTSDGGYTVTGYTSSTDGDVTGNHGSYDCWTVKLSSGAGIEDLSSLNQVNIFPNPVSSEFKIQSAGFKIKEIEVYDLMGKKIYSNRFTQTINASQWSNGIYFLKMTDGEKIFVSKIVKE